MIRRKVSVKAIKTVASTERTRQIIREAFLKLTNTSSWKEAQKAYPEYTTDDILSQFQELDFKEELPEVHKCDSSARGCI